jgi:hypothetical protein
VFDIGPGGESMGIWLLATRNMTISANEIYLVRKEGIRDWYGLDNSFVSNRVYLNWVGIALESAVGDYVANNFAYDNVYGFNPKHVSEPTALTMWGLSTGQWSRFWHNTTYGNTHADIALGMNTPIDDYIDVRDNVFGSVGDVHIHDFPTLRGTNIIVDGNVYSGSAPIYYAGWSNPHTPVYATLAQVQAGMGWEAHGQVFTPQFRNPAAGDLSFGTSGMQPGVTLPDSYGAQLGAVGLPPAVMGWTRYATHQVTSTPEPPFLSLPAAGDARDDSYWWSTNYSTNASIVYDLGASVPVNTFVLDVFAQCDVRNTRNYAIEVSSDDVHWSTVLSGANPDSEGSSYKYTLATPVTARYVRLDLLSSFGGSTVLFSDFGVGLLAGTGASSTAAHASSPAGTAPTVGPASLAPTVQATTTATARRAAARKAAARRAAARRAHRRHRHPARRRRTRRLGR